MLKSILCGVDIEVNQHFIQGCKDVEVNDKNLKHTTTSSHLCSIISATYVYDNIKFDNSSMYVVRYK